MTNDTSAQVLELGAEWARAEQDGNTEVLDQITVAGFRLVGPFGFVLDKTQWLDRYLSGDLVTTSLTWDDVVVRDFGEAAIAIGRQTQKAAYKGAPSDGQFRVTHVFVMQEQRWMLAGIHLSLASPPGPPPSS
jgi:hypothetical protein